MASSQYSILRQYTPYVNPYNIDLIKDVTMYKQGKVDAAREKIYTQMDYLMGQEIDKPEARAYMEDKMSAVVADINNKFKGMDLSSDGVTRAIQGQISTVLDDTVINAIAGTKEGKRVRNEIESIRLNHPELYSPINEWEAMKPYYEWRSDGKAGSRLGALHYSPYVDYNKELNKAVLDYRKNNKGKKIQTLEYDLDGNPTGGIIEMSVDELSDFQIRNFVSANLSENMRNQMRIEASYMAATNPVFGNQQMIGQYLNSYPERFDRYIGALEAKKKAVGDNKAAIDRLDSQIQEAKNQKAESRREIDMIIASADPVDAANFVVTSNLFDKMADAWKYDNTGFERKKDDLYFARLKEDREQKKFVTDNAKSLAEIQLLNEQIEQQKLQTEYMKTYGMKMGTAGKGSKPGSLTSSGGKSDDRPVAINAGTGGVQSVNLANIPYNQLTSASTERKANVLRFYNLLPEEDRNNILAAIQEEEKSNPGLYSNMSLEDQVFSYIKNNGGQKNGYLGQGNNKLSETYDAILSLDSKINSSYKAINSVADMQASNLLTDQNINIVNAVIDKNIAPEYREDTKKQVRGLIFGAALMSGYGSEKGNFLGLRSLGGVLYGKEYEEFVKRMDISSGKFGTGTGAIAYINNMKKVNGDPDFNISDYLEIGEGGNVKLKDYKQGEPLTITQLRYLNDNPEVSKEIATSLNESIKASSTPDAVSETLSQNHYIDSYKMYVWNAGAKTGSIEDIQMKGLESVLAGRIENLDPTSIKRISLNTEFDGGVVRRTLSAYAGTGKNAAVIGSIEVSDDDLRAAGIDPSIEQRNYPVDDYKSDFGSCNFVDTGKKEGHSYDKYLVRNGLPRLASKVDVKNDFYDLIKTYGSYLKPEDMAIIKNVADNFIDLSDNVVVQLEGDNDRGSKEIVVNLYDKRTQYSKNPALIGSYYIPLDPGNDDYADYWNNIHQICPQYFYVEYVKDAIMERLDQMRDGYIKGVSVTPDNSDKFSKLNDFSRKNLWTIATK